MAHIAAAPQRSSPGRVFAYDNGGSHLIAAAATRLLGEPVSEYADRVLFTPLGIRSPTWQSDPDGTPVGYGHLRLAARDLARLGQLWLDRGAPLVAPAFFAEMTRPQSAGGPPENLPYGFLTWLDEGVLVADGWAGQHLVVVPQASAVVVVTGVPRFDPGLPARDELPEDWRPAVHLVRRHLLPVLVAH